MARCEKRVPTPPPVEYQLTLSVDEASRVLAVLERCADIPVAGVHIALRSAGAGSYHTTQPGLLITVVRC